MHIVVGNENIDKLGEKYIVLELDTFKTNDVLIPTYCVIDFENINVNDLSSITNSKELHENLIKNYKEGNIKYCTDAIKYLRGKFNGELDTFYDEVSTRINNVSDSESWDSIIYR